MVSLVFLRLAAGRAEAGGLYLYEIGTEDFSIAGAGSAARAQDAATIANNPAGMTRLEGNQLVEEHRCYTGTSIIHWTIRG